MAYEFKKLSDVEVVETPTDSANVLIEENGVIKKVDKKLVGPQEEYDAILYWEWIDSSPDYGSLTLEFGTYDAILSKLQNWEMPKILIKHHSEYGNRSLGCFVPYDITYEATDDLVPEGQITIATHSRGTLKRSMPDWFYIYSDNTVECSN